MAQAHGDDLGLGAHRAGVGAVDSDVIGRAGGGVEGCLGLPVIGSEEGIGPVVVRGDACERIQGAACVDAENGVSDFVDVGIGGGVDVAKARFRSGPLPPDRVV